MEQTIGRMLQVLKELERWLKEVTRAAQRGDEAPPDTEKGRR